MLSPNSCSSSCRASSKWGGAIGARSASSVSFNAAGLYDPVLATAKSDAAGNAATLSATVFIAGRARAARSLLEDSTTPLGDARAHASCGRFEQERLRVEAAHGVAHGAQRIPAQALQIEARSSDAKAAVGELLRVDAQLGT